MFNMIHKGNEQYHVYNIVQLLLRLSNDGGKSWPNY